jgi:hypothetical protein
MAKANNSLSSPIPVYNEQLSKRLIKQAQLHRQAVIQFARLATKNAVKAEMRAQGIRLTLVFPCDHHSQGH